MRRRTFLAGAGALIAAPAVARAQGRIAVTLGVGGKPVLYYLPLSIAERKGFLSGEGLDVTINDFGGGAKALQALVGGSVDVVTGAYEHTIRMQAKGQDIRATCELGRFSGITIGVRASLKDQIKSAADFKGRKIGVSAPGSSTYLTALYAMSKVGLSAKDASFIGVGTGAGAVAAMQKGEIDVMSNAEPIISKLEETGDLVVLIDTRTEAGSKALFGGSCPAATLYAPHSYAEKNQEAMQKLVNAFVKTLHWLAKATPEEVADAMPKEYQLGDPGLYRRAVKASLESYSRDGMITEAGQNAVYAMLKAIDPAFKDASIDLKKTFDDRFVKNVKA